MTFDEVLAQVLALLQRERRLAYRALKLRFDNEASPQQATGYHKEEHYL